jgi:hypothetical protein
VETEVTTDEAAPDCAHPRRAWLFKSAPAFATVVAAAIASDDPRDIVIDLSGLAYLDEHGLAILLAARSFCERMHVGVVLVPGPAPVRCAEVGGDRHAGRLPLHRSVVLG